MSAMSDVSALQTTQDPTLAVQGLSKSFTLHLRDGLQLPVLSQISFDVSAGECVALVGPSGQGKSTLMKCLYGSYGADQGAIWFQGDAGLIDLANATPHELLRQRRRAIAHVSQFLRAMPRVSALDIVAERVLGAHPPPLDDDSETQHALARQAARDKARDMLARLRLPQPLWALPPATFSGGEQQRVNLARGLVEPSRLLLLDEPTAALDAANRRIVIELITQAKARGCAVVGIFHDDEVRAALAERSVPLHSAGSAAHGE